MAQRKIVMRSVADLRPHPLNKELYGPPTANSAYKDLKVAMGKDGFDERHPLLITADERILRGVTRWAAAKAAGLTEVPCEVFLPSSEETAELEIERALVAENRYRVKTQVMLAREQRKLLEVETVLARRRMGSGGDDGPSKSTDRVGKVFGESGKTVQRRIKILEAIEKAEGAGEHRKAERLTELLDGGKTVQALEVISPKEKKQPIRKVDVPKTIHAHITAAYSENYEGCCKARCEAEIDLLEENLERMRQDIETARGRVKPA
jgi:ParB-like chromosome segregation protein Spo0J